MNPERDNDAVVDAALAAHLGGQRFASRVSPGAVLGEVRRRRTRRRAVIGGLAGTAAVGLAGVAVAFGGGGEGSLRARGTGHPAPAVAVVALAESAEGLRPVRDGDTLRADEALVIRVTAGGDGVLSVRADGRPLWPADGAIAVGPGEHWLGGEVPLAWTPDVDRTARHVVIAELCAPTARDRDPSACATSAITVSWER